MFKSSKAASSSNKSDASDKYTQQSVENPTINMTSTYHNIKLAVLSYILRFNINIK